MRGIKNSREKERICLYLEKETLDWIRENMGLADVTCVSEFIDKANDFYKGYLSTNKTETYVMHSVSSMIHSTIDLSEMRIKDMMFKLAVEIDIQNRILAMMTRVTEEEIAEIRAASEDEVRRIFR